MKTNCITLATVFYTALSSHAAEPLSWVRKPNQPAPAQFDTFHGESLDFRCTFTGFGALPFAGDDAPRLYYQTNGMGAAWWSLPATVSSNALTATFTPDLDPGADRLSVFFGAPSNAYAAAQVRFRNSPGTHPNDIEPPSVLDWQAELSAATNALASNVYTKEETDARIVELAPPTSLAPATNYANVAVTTISNALVIGDFEVSQASSARFAERVEDTYNETFRTGTELFAQIDAKTSTNDVCNIVTNDTGGTFGAWQWSCTSFTTIWGYHPETTEDTGYRYANEDSPLRYEAGKWKVGFEIFSYDPYYDEFIPWGPDWRSFEIVGDGLETELEFDCDYYGMIVATRTYTPGHNALGLARLSDVTNIAEDAAAAATVGLLSAESDPLWDAAKGGYATTGTVAQVSEAVGTLWSYVYGDSVWIAVTNYMRTIGGVSPSFQLWEVRDGATNLVYWSKEEITNVTHDLIHDCKTNLEATVRNAVAEMPDKAWSKYQSATGNEAPDGVTIVSTPTIQLTGGGEWYRYVDVASNSVWFLKSNGLHTFGGDTNGYFRILDDEGNATFEVRKTDSYLVDAVASSVHFDASGNFCVSFESNVEPVIYTTATLEHPNFLPQGEDPNVTVTWTQSGGVYTAKLEQAVKGPSLFAYAKVEVLGETVIRNTVPTDLQGGIIVNGVKYSVGTATIDNKTVLTLTPRN